MKLTFLGANRQVTGSRYCLHVGDSRVLIDCGLFQERAFAHRNWDRCPVSPGLFDAVLLTHAHIDHSGLIPRFVSAGFKKKIYATKPTVALAKIMLRDSAEIQMEDAAYKKKRHNKAKRRPRFPEEPLYDVDDAERALSQFKGLDYGEPFKVGESMTVRFHDAGHILGSAMIEVTAIEDGELRTIVFSGDIGQWDKPLIHDPSLLQRADCVIMESTYGNRDHDRSGDAETEFARIINDTAERGGKVVIPTFAVERAQELMYHIGRLVHGERIPAMPVFLDSPMAIDVTDIFQQYEDWLDDEARQLLHSGEPPLQFPGLQMTRSVQESQAINRFRGPCIIMSASGMCTAGRIKHHLRQNISNPNSTILFVGYQADGTLGREILEGKPEVRIHGRMYPVTAKIEKINGFSAHAGRADLVRWLGGFQPKPKQVFLTHGEERVSLELAEELRSQLGLDVEVPQYDSTVDLM